MPKGNVSCFLADNGKSSEAHYDSAESLPDEFIDAALGPAHD